MRYFEPQALHRWFILLTLCVSALTLQCCGKADQGPLEVELQVPAGEDPGVFWLGVTSRTLHVVPQKGDSEDFAWESGAENAVDLRRGDKISFLGTDQNGRLLVTGETTVGEEKKATISLARVL